MDRGKIKKAVEVLRQGGVVIYPTDTLYGLGVDATNPMAVQRLMKLKGRDVSKGISVMVTSVKDIPKFTRLALAQRAIVSQKLPGPYTFIFKVKPKVAIAKKCLSSGRVAVRVPDHPIALKLTKIFGRPITATSANLAGKPPANSLKALQSLEADYVLWVGELPKSRPSTVVDLTQKNAPPRILRGGAGHWP